MKKIVIIVIAFLLCIGTLCLNDSATVVYAAEEGTMLSNAVDVTFGQTYSKSWTWNTDHLNHYCKVIVPSQGIVTVEATKPYDSEGEYGRIEFALYQENGEKIWSAESRKSKDNAKSVYSYKIGLDAGTYYMTIAPGFKVRSGNIETTYSFSFENNGYCEIEPNEGLAQATTMTIGKEYTGYLGSESGDDKYDYYKVELTEGKTYKIAIGNYAKLSGSTALIKFVTPDGDEKSTKMLANQVDDDGMNYMLYTAGATGKYYIKFYNYNGEQIEYQVLVAKYAKQSQTIMGIEDSYTIEYSGHSSSFYLNPVGTGTITAESSDSDVASVSVYSSGKITVWAKAIGKATIKIKASGDQGTKSATKKITVQIKPASAKIASVDNKHSYLQVNFKWNYFYDIDGYNVQVSTDKEFKKNVKKYNFAASKENGNLKNLTLNKTYYVRVRTYVKVDGKRVYSDWSKTVKKKLK